MDDIVREFSKVQKRANLGSCEGNVDELLAALQETKALLEQDPANAGDLIASLQTKITSSITQLNDNQKEIYNGLNKYGKSIEKYYKADLSLVNNTEAFKGKEGLVSRAVAMHLIREGEFNIANEFVTAAGIHVPASLQSDFSEMYEILDPMRHHNLEPAISWAASKREALENRGSHLEFDLHRLQFVQLFLESSPEDALQYARSKFGDFQAKYLGEIQKLMCAFLYSSSLKSSPYASIFLSANTWADAGESFTREFCSLLGLSAESPLQIAATAGTIALPQLLKMATIMKEKRTEWSSQDELPVEIPLPARYGFHSIFVCPVSKEQTTEENPPMMMPCGHVVAKESLAKLSKNHSQRFKCPYCPSESLASQAMKCTF